MNKWHVSIKMWQVNRTIWQVDIIIWQVMTETWLHTFILNWIELLDYWNSSPCVISLHEQVVFCSSCSCIWYRWLSIVTVIMYCLTWRERERERVRERERRFSSMYQEREKRSQWIERERERKERAQWRERNF